MSHPPTPDVPESNQPPQEPTPPQYAPPQYAPPQYAAPQYAPPQYGQPQYAPPPLPQTQVPQAHYPQMQPAQPGSYPAPPYGHPAPQVATVLPPPGPGEPFDGALHSGELYRPLYGASMGAAFIRFFKNYANFSGRASRSEYWWMSLVFLLAFVLIGLVGGLLAAAFETAPYGSGISDFAGGFLGMVFIVAYIGIIIPSIALAWRRLHDANLAGPLFLLVLIPYVGSLIVFVFTLLPPKPAGRRFDQPRR